MNKGILVLAGVLLVGGVGYFYLKNKKKPTLASGATATDGTTPATTDGTTPASTTPTTPTAPTKTLSEEDLNKVNALKENIKSNIDKRGKYKKASSRNNVQAEIDKDMAELLKLGYLYLPSGELKLVK